jgi:PAS domain S-box-containing protein
MDNPPLSELYRSHLAAIVASSDDAIVSKDLDGIIRSWNTAAERMFGYSSDEMVGKPIAILVPPERGSEEAEILERLRRGERLDHFQTVRLRKDGRRILVSVTISPIKDSTGRVIGASKIARDVTRISELEAMYSSIVASADDAIVSKDLDGIVQSWNTAAEQIFGYTAEEMIGRSITTIIPADRQHEEIDILARLRRGERIEHFETMRQRKDGQLIDVSVTISPIRDRLGRITGASKIARDITLIKRMTEEREQLLQSERAARREAERVSRMKDEFLATASHELRTPLNAILGWSQLLQTRGVSDQDFREGMETIERNARIQTRLIEELLDVSRIISGKVRLETRPLDLKFIIQEVVATMHPAADAKGIRVGTSLSPTAGAIMGDPARIQQIIWNLISNAIKFTPRGGSVDIDLRRVESHVEMVVSDTGQGITPDFLPLLFTRFAQADATTTRRHGGLGLGLAIVRHLTELHGGTIRASSPGQGKGATFTVCLPLAALHERRSSSNDDDESDADDAGLANPALDLSGVKVLVVDDDPDARQLIRRVLESHGASVATAESSAQGLEALKRERPAILLADIGMPDEDGYRFLSRVRALPKEQGGATPAVALTAFARAEDRRRALLSGFQQHLAKPAETAELLAVVSNLSGKLGSPPRG